MKTPTVAFGKATEALSKLLEGKTPKEVAHEVGLVRQRMTDVKKMFPLFLGLTNEYDKDDN